MSNQNYITDLLELKDSNIFFKENCYYKEETKGVIHKIFEGYLSYIPNCCPKCGVQFDNNFEKHGFITSDIIIPDVIGFKSILRLHKQRYLCKHCNKFKQSLSNINPKVSSYMKTSIKTIIEFLPFIKNTFENEYHNGFIEGNNNFIKVLKRIAFGFRSFRRFKARIMICKGLIKIKKTANV